MPAIPTKLYEAFEKIRLGKIDDGLRLFDRVDGCEPIKSAVLAELSYFRHDWKRGIQYARDFLESEEALEMSDSFMNSYLERHLMLFVLCTCHLDSWVENRAYLQELRKKYESRNTPYKNYGIFQQAVSFISDPESTKRHLLDSRPKLKKKGTVDWEKLEREAARAVMCSSRSSRKMWASTFDGVANDAYHKASTEDHLAFYERFFDCLEEGQSHYNAAKSYIALENPQKARDAIRHYVSCWAFREPYQVAPIELFIDPELWPVMSDQRFTESLLTIPRCRER